MSKSIRVKINEGVKNTESKLLETSIACLKELQNQLWNKQSVHIEDIIFGEKIGMISSLLICELPKKEQKFYTELNLNIQ